ncbi:hypothetical protein MMC21_003952 [Puttea exsequens]|nr:hypothetical protein [Puttea exsequens]
MGVQYLRIDSLCITQDRKSDSIEEAPLAGDVYSHSCCNIAATKAHNATQGCFAKRQLIDVKSCMLSANWRSHLRQLFVSWVQDTWTGNVDDETLLHRAWVHFAKQQMFWECLELSACETFPDGIPNNNSTKVSADTYSLRNEIIKSENPQRQQLLLWQSFVDRYTQGDLSFPENDKLVAIPGLTKKIGEGSDYLAGLWRQDLISGLMWSVSHGNDISRCSRPAQFQAPSWSWASVNGPLYFRVSFEHDDSTALVKILEAQMQCCVEDLLVKSRVDSLESKDL